MHFSEKKNIENYICVGAEARKVENPVCFFTNFDPYFLNIWRVRKKCKIYIESSGRYCKNIESTDSR